MRLLHNRTYQLHQFFGTEIPPYAILSHTWGTDEVTFKDVKKPHKLAPARRKRGWRKIELTCHQALEDGLEYAWIDTCCIDKSSSAELSEAINSMYKWYESSEACYVWLEDYVGGEVKRTFAEHMQKLNLGLGGEAEQYRQKRHSAVGFHQDDEDEEIVLGPRVDSAKWDAADDDLATVDTPLSPDGMPALSSRVLSFDDFGFSPPEMVMPMGGESRRGSMESRRSSLVALNPPRPRDVPRPTTEGGGGGGVRQDQNWYYQRRLSKPKIPPHIYEEGSDVQPASGFEDMKDCRYWQRGWCLQELLAPQKVILYNQHWDCIGSKHELSSQISQYTRIPRTIIEKKAEISSVSVAQRMSWASSRETTRIEDMAYCLLGIFGVNMALLYGEGKKAFLRLQEEILRETDDQSLFAWIDPDTDPNAWHGLFATSPAMFAECRQFVSFRDWAQPSLAGMTSSGLSITLPLAREYGDVFTARLNCASTPYTARPGDRATKSDDDHFSVISLLRLPGQGNHYARVRAQWNMKVTGKQYNPTQVIIRQSPVKPRHGDINMARSLFIAGIVAEDDHLISSASAWNPTGSPQLIDLPGPSQTPSTTSTNLPSLSPLSPQSSHSEPISSPSPRISTIPLSSSPHLPSLILALQPKFYFSTSSFPFFLLLGPGTDPGTVACRYIDEVSAANALLTCQEGYRPDCAECFRGLSREWEVYRQPTRYFHRDGRRDRTIGVDSRFDEGSGAIAVSVEVSMGQYGKEWLLGLARRDGERERENGGGMGRNGYGNWHGHGSGNGSIAARVGDFAVGGRGQERMHNTTW